MNSKLHTVCDGAGRPIIMLLSEGQMSDHIGERIRDKIAASKKKGLWMGGIVPYGYRLENRRLLVDPAEAEVVRQIFALYLELRSLPRLARSLADRGILSRPRIFASGGPVGGKPFRTGALSHLLGNRMYLGEINHRGKSYPGEHAPIIAPEMFAAVQAFLAQRRNRKHDATGKSQALLAGLIFDDAGNRMTPVHAQKGPIRYRYYQSWVIGHGHKDKAGTISRVPAGEVERAFMEAVEKRFLGQNEALPNIESQAQCMRAIISKVTIHRQHIAVELNTPVPVTAAVATDGASSNLPSASVSQLEDSASHQDQPEIITVAWAKPTSTRNRQVLAPSGLQQPALPLKAETRAKILTSIAQARHWLDQLANGKVQDIAALARRHDRSEKSVRSLLSLALLAPDIVEAAVSNRLPRGFGITNLTDLSPDWREQRRQLGLS